MIGILLIILSVIFLAIPVTATLYSKFGYFKRFYHDILKWHEPTDECWWDGWDSPFQYEDKEGTVVGCYLDKHFIDKADAERDEYYASMAQHYIDDEFLQ